MADQPHRLSVVHAGVGHAAAGFKSFLARVTTAADGSTFDVAHEQPLLSLDQPFSNHNGGNILFGPDGYLYFGLGDGGSGGDPRQRRAEPRAAASARSCASTSTAPDAPTPSRRQPVRATARGQARRSTPTACATRGAGASIAPPASCGSATSARTLWEEVDKIADRRQLRLEHVRGHPLLQRRRQRPGSRARAGLDRAHRRLRAQRSARRQLDHRRLRLSRHARCRRWSAATLRRLRHRAASVAHRLRRRRQGAATSCCSRPARTSSSFGEGIDGELYVVSYGDGTIYKLVPAGAQPPDDLPADAVGDRLRRSRRMPTQAGRRR